MFLGGFMRESFFVFYFPNSFCKLWRKQWTGNW